MDKATASAQDPIHKRLMETKQTFMTDEKFETEKATEAAVHKRKSLSLSKFSMDLMDLQRVVAKKRTKPKIYLGILCEKIASVPS